MCSQEGVKAETLEFFSKFGSEQRFNIVVAAQIISPSKISLPSNF